MKTMQGKKPKLTISLLASDRPDTIRRCLDSLQPLRDAIESELILIDTSKSSFIHEILLEYTDLVYEFEWCNDFAKARNEGMKRARGEWFMFLDDDEWFEDVSGIVQFFQSGEYKRYGYANHQIRNYMNASHSKYTDDWVSRLVHMDEYTRFLGKIHERFGPVRGERKDLNVLSFHSGYIYETEEEKLAHFQRNMRLLEEVMKEEPDVLRWKAQAAIEYIVVNDWQKVIDNCKEYIRTAPENLNDFERKYLAVFYGCYMKALTTQQKYEEAILVASQAEDDERNIELVKAFAAFIKGGCHYLRKETDLAAEYYQKYLDYYQILLKNPSMLIEQKQTLFINEIFEDRNLNVAYSNLILYDTKKGSTKLLNLYYDKLRENETNLYKYKKIEITILEIMAVMEYEPIFSRVAKDVYENISLRNYIGSVIQFWEDKDTEGFEKIRYVYEQAGLGGWFDWAICRKNAVVSGPKSMEQLTEYYNILKGYVNKVEDFYRSYYNKELSEYGPEEIPRDAQVAVTLKEFFDLETKDKKLAMNKLDECAVVYPKFAQGIDAFKELYLKREEQRANNPQNEMLELRDQIMVQVRNLIANGQPQAALGIVRQLKQMLPNDVELELLEAELLMM